MVESKSPGQSSDLDRLDKEVVTYGVTADDFQAMTDARTELEHDSVARTAAYDRLREKYKDNPEALETIDIHDPGSEYAAKRQEYVEALKTQDQAKIEKLMSWFTEHYPISESRSG